MTDFWSALTYGHSRNMKVLDFLAASLLADHVIAFYCKLNASEYIEPSLYLSVGLLD